LELAQAAAAAAPQHRQTEATVGLVGSLRVEVEVEEQLRTARHQAQEAQEAQGSRSLRLISNPMNASDPQQIAEVEGKAKRKRDQSCADLLSVMATHEGRRFVWRILEGTGIYKLSYTGNSETFFNEGQRNVGLKLLSELQKITPSEYLKMTEECQLK
jgi:hypothetical protein